MYIPTENIRVVGFRVFRIVNPSATSHKVNFNYRVFDQDNTNKLLEGDLRRIKLEYTDFPVDDNKVLTYNFTEDFGKAKVEKMEPIPVSAG